MKNRIKETAAKLFQENGYHHTSMREIAEALNVTKAALYYHYSNKEELFLSIIEDATGAMNSFFDNLDYSRSYSDILRDWIQAMVRQRYHSPYLRKLIFYLMMGRYRNQIHIDFRSMMENGIVAFRKMIIQAREEGSVRSDLPLDFVIKFIITTVQGMLNEIEERPLLNFKEMEEDVLTDAIMSVIKGGIEKK